MADSIGAGAEGERGSSPPVEHRPASSDIARRRAARDLWISRNHVAAAGVGALAFAALSFGGGLVLGKRWATPAVLTPPSLTAEVPRDELLRLLARIDGNAAGPSAALTFPDALRGQPSTPGPAADPTGGPTTVLAAGPVTVTGDAMPAQGFTVVLATTEDEPEAAATRRSLAQAGIAAWVGAEIVDGAPRYRVGVGRHATRAEAVEAARLLSGAGTPVVEEVVPPPAPAPSAEPVEVPAPDAEAPTPDAPTP